MRHESIALRQQLKKQESDIERQKCKLAAQLEKVARLLEEAKKKVIEIKKVELEELRSLKSPPEMVKMCLEAIFVLLAQKDLTWDKICRLTSRRDFVTK
jgi:Na+/phosphate symporter